jgi:hypothetical protein
MSEHEQPEAAVEETEQKAPPGLSDPAEAPPPGEPAAGDPRVDEALMALGAMEATSVHEHAAVIEEVHRALQDTLAEEQD